MTFVTEEGEGSRGVRKRPHIFGGLAPPKPPGLTRGVHFKKITIILFGDVSLRAASILKNHDFPFEDVALRAASILIFPMIFPYR